MNNPDTRKGVAVTRRLMHYFHGSSEVLTVHQLVMGK
jgi:hypothetical protein